jgi:hypothetical protein
MFSHIGGRLPRLINIRLILIISMLVLSSASSAAWFSATGQAVVINNDKEKARQQATQEAIRQALLFAGASVTSVQKIANGLLLNDQLEVRATGEVSAVELIDEVYKNGVVTVSIRADIFAQDSKCPSADYTKLIATTYFPIRYEGQAANGQIHQLGKEVSMKFQGLMNRMTPKLNISHIEPYIFDWHLADFPTQARSLAQQANAQYVLTMTLDDISVEKQRGSALTFYKGDEYVRAFDFTVALINGATGQRMFEQTYRSQAPWNFDPHEAVDVGSQRFWQSLYGQNIVQQIQTSVADMEEQALCEPTMGRILAVANNQAQINLGRNHQVQAGDTLTLFNVKNISDNFGQEYRQFVLHPTAMVVKQVFASTATIAAADNSYIGNIQPNDYVARK